MEYRLLARTEVDAVEALFADVFTNAESADEGILVSRLAREIITVTDPSELPGCIAVKDGQITGCILFSKVTMDSPVEARMLAPVAIATAHQGKGIGQALIRYGLDVLRILGIELVITYGDPRFYGKVGFEPISPRQIQPPYELSQPVGWLGQSLGESPLERIRGACTCVKPLMDPVYW